MGRSYWMPWRVRFPVALLLTCIRAYGTTDLTGVTLVPAVDAGVEISADIDTLRESGQLVSVKWSGKPQLKTQNKCNHFCERLPPGNGDVFQGSGAAPGGNRGLLAWLAGSELVMCALSLLMSCQNVLYYPSFLIGKETHHFKQPILLCSGTRCTKGG
jgi:hypothetical protein